MECSLDDEGKSSFKLSEPVTVIYKDENLQTKGGKSPRIYCMVVGGGAKAGEIFTRSEILIINRSGDHQLGRICWATPV
ncbi:hypothetical protein RhiirA1_429116 [Rhizophagus irregularis]|uniref:Uncharacterized protein n=1 Tax=Rhizophagus irregularis TaxID=588596 RepID=A0A2N0QZJ3_9GLOM|nr:hypothetical protein RhiirA1_429116 [Rhizophagus irregularis]